MQANEFVKKYGLEHAKDVSSGWITNYENVNLDDLKRLIKSHELVKSHGGLDAANKTICDAFHGSNYPIPEGHEELSLAMQDVESCQ